MDVLAEYKALYQKYIIDRAKVIIIKYNVTKKNYEYQPYSHELSSSALDKLVDLVIDNMVFYAFTENEIINRMKKFGLLDDLKVAARYAYKSRLPHRKDPNKDGTAGEVLLDMLIQVFEPSSKKLIARGMYRQQGDNNEIKGYDALYFTQQKKEISLWLGQVKTGSRDYCKSSIITDLNEKYILDYFCQSLYYIADKVDNSHDLSNLLNDINLICFNSIEKHWTEELKKEKIINLLIEKEIKIKIPCLLSYTDKCYEDPVKFRANLESSMNKMIEVLDNKKFAIDKELDHEVLFYFFPVKDISELRNKLTTFKEVM